MDIKNMTMKQAMKARDELVEHVQELRRKQVDRTCEEVRLVIGKMPHVTSFQDIAKELFDHGVRLDIVDADDQEALASEADAIFSQKYATRESNDLAAAARRIVAQMRGGAK